MEAKDDILKDILNNTNGKQDNGTEPDDSFYAKGDVIENLFSDDLNIILRHGTSLLFAVGVALITAAAFFTWPETLKAPAQLSTETPSHEIVSRTTARISSILVQNGDHVEQGDVLARLQGDANDADVHQLGLLVSQIDSLYATDLTLVSKLNIGYYQFSQLGSLQPVYEVFMRSYNDLTFALSDNFLQTKLNLLNSKMRNLEGVGDNLEVQKQVKSEDLLIATQNYDNEVLLQTKGASTAYEVDKFKSIMLSKKLSYNLTLNQILVNEQNKNDVSERRVQLLQSITTPKSAFIQSFKNLQTALNNYIHTYTLIAPKSGVVSFPIGLGVGKVISPQSIAMYIRPDSTKTIAIVQVGQFNFSKIHKGMPVNIKLQGYPFEECGLLQGTVEFIAGVPVESQYQIQVALPQDLVTNIGTQVHFVQGLEGEVEIVLEERSLLSRLVRKAFKVAS
ncbi:MAG: HlyD family efflux transporter periplasmic adaptor subunit [Bacteroidia bacterium]|nr:HlyD family efflux transporter periplasmic adaptor subunit [Bacteroidia bacterium]